MKIKIIAGTMVALSFSLMSCSDFLTEDPRGKTHSGKLLLYPG